MTDEGNFACDMEFRKDIIEKNILDNSARVLEKIDPDDQSWLKSEEMEAFLDSWTQLESYYLGGADTVISVLIVREYIHYCRMMQDLISAKRDPSSDLEITQDSKNRAKEIISKLEGFMDEIIKEVERYVNNLK